MHKWSMEVQIEANLLARREQVCSTVYLQLVHWGVL